MTKKTQYTIDDIMTIGEAVTRYGVKRTTLRYYINGERLSVVDPAQEIEAGRIRIYSPPGDLKRRELYVTRDFIERYFNADGSPKSK